MTLENNDYSTHNEFREGLLMKDTDRQVKVAQPVKRHGANWNDSNYGCTAASQQTNSIFVPIWQKAALTVEEAAAYSNIGVTKLYEITNNPVCSFVLHVGSRKRLIKRKEFEKYLSQSIEI